MKREVRVDRVNGRPTAVVDGRALALPAYSPVGPRRLELFKQQTARFFEHGMGAYFLTIPPAKSDDFFATPFWVGDRISSHPLVEPCHALDVIAEHLMGGDPEALFIIRFGLYEPKSWRDLHPDQLFVNENQEPLGVPSLASELWMDAVARFSAAVIEYCEARPWADRIIGYANFMREEGTHDPLIHHWLFDHGETMKACWRRYLKKTYVTEAALREAHNDAGASFDAASIPRDELRGPAAEVSNLHYWQESRENQALRDYLLLTRDLFHRHFTRVAESMRRAAPRNRFFVYDALKQSMLGWSNTGFFDQKISWPTAYPELMAGSGHMNVAELFDVPGFDGLITPHDYQARGIGGVYEPEGIADSMVLRGKLFFCEMDTRSYTGTDINYPARDDREFAAITWRNLAAGWTRGFNSYPMDVYQDWFGNDGLHRILHRQVAAMKESLEWPHETVPGIAMILDDAAVLETSGAGNFFNEAIMWEQKMGMARCGVPYRIYLLDDLKLDTFPRHAVYYFPNLFKVDDERLALLREKVFRDGHVVLWGPGSGISDGHKIGVDSAARLTGFHFDLIKVNHPRRTLISNFDHPITQGLRADTLLGGPLAYGPVLLPTDGVSLGEAWTKAGRVMSGLAVKDMDGWTSVFTTAVSIPADLWRGLARFGGAHVYCESNDVLLADRSIVALHSVQSGEKRLSLPAPSTVVDVITGQTVGEGLQTITFTLRAPETRVFRIIA